MRSFLLKRLPLLLFALLGIWLWQGGAGFFPTERELTWRLWGEYGQIRKVELQLWQGDSLVKREELSYPTGVTFEPTQKVPLSPGQYAAKVFIWRAAAAQPESKSGTITVSTERAQLVAL